EIRMVAQLEHPAIVPVYDVGEEDGMPFFVMRYMSGGSLTDWIERGRFSLEDTARIIEKITQALSYAHRRGVIHRDLKPDNILFDGNGEPFVSDFGVAKFSEAATNLTGSGIIGTPAYMSPEQAQGEPVDNRADVYGLGVIIYQMLSGKQPYHADTPMGVVLKHVTEPIPQILKANPDLPEAMDTIIKSALAKDKQKRYASVTDLSRALNLAAFGTESITANAPLTTPPIKTTHPAAAGNRAWPIFSLVLLLVLVVGGFFLRNQLFIPATGSSTAVSSRTPAPTLEPSAAAPQPTAIDNPTPTIAVVEVILAPVCPAGAIPTVSKPVVRETNKDCIKKVPYTTISIPTGATFESLREGFSCIKEGETENNVLISCTGQHLFSFDLKVCNPQPVPTPVAQSDAGRCDQGTNFDSANQCCVPPPAEDASCTIFQVDLRACS
ncbi:MAG TPA: serine/threonine-protein kinase, partial [Candidatus Binatia bacterium]|nr:serine/threonine-protein kinase [Candidatus Binatia bacterium]